MDEPEGIYDDLALYGLNGIHDDGDGTRVELLERLLGVDIDGGQPASETGMGVVPSYNRLWSI